MFGRKKAEVALMERPVPVTHKELMSEVVPDDYVELCEYLCHDPVELRKKSRVNEFMEFASSENIPVYNTQAVSAYLWALARSKGKNVIWGWAPLSSSMPNNTHYSNGQYFSVYSKKVPVEALRVAAKIKAEYPDASFYVSEFTKMIPDPFMSVLIPGAEEHIVFAVWDEPSYTLAG